MSQPPHDQLMVDIETMSTRPNATIVSIGACLFSPIGEDTEDSIRAEEDRCFYQVISLESNEQAGRHFQAGTIEWWFKQDEAARTALFENSHITNLATALYRFRRWAQDALPKVNRIWAKSPDFDCTILASAFGATNDLWPFKFWESRCVRTAVEMAYPDGDQPQIGVGTAHHALDDAIRQALMVQHCHHVLGR